MKTAKRFHLLERKVENNMKTLVMKYTLWLCYNHIDLQFFIVPIICTKVISLLKGDEIGLRNLGTHVQKIVA